MAGADRQRTCILVADDYALSRESISLLLARILPEAMVFEISADEDRAAFEPSWASLVLFHLRPPYLKALNVLHTLRRRFPAAPVMLLSEVLDPKLTFMARARGASALFHTSGDTSDLLAAMRHLLDGKPNFPPERRKSGSRPPSDYRFSPRQVEVLALLCKGKSNKEIGVTLRMSDNTVGTHVAAIFNILGVRNRTEAVILGSPLI